MSETAYHRPHEETRTEELFEELDYLDHQSLTGQNRGRRALEELLVRAGYLNDDYFALPRDMQQRTMVELSHARAFVSLQQWADDHGIDADLGLDPERWDG